MGKLKKKGEDIALNTFFKTNKAARETKNLITNLGVAFGAPVALSGLLKGQRKERAEKKEKEKLIRQRRALQAKTKK